MRVELRDSLEFLYADSRVRARPCRSLRLDVARGGTASVHLLLEGAPAGQALRVALRRRGAVVRPARWFRLVPVPVEANTGPVGFIEKEGEQNPFVARRAPFRVADAMEPVRFPLETGEPAMALRLHLPVPPEARPGQTTYSLEVQIGREREELALEVQVHRALIPPVGRDSLPYTNWFSLDLMAQRHGLELWSPAHWQMVRRYAELMAHGRQNAFWCPLGCVFEVVGGVPVLDVGRLGRIVDTFTRAGLYYVEGGHVASRTGGEWNAATFDLAVVGGQATAVAGNAALFCMAGQLMEQVECRGWRPRWIQHVTDEPTQSNAADYRILAGMVRKYMPGIPLLDATMDPALAGAVDIWCPQAQEYQRHRQEFEALRDLGDRVWFYTCCFPGGPWLNRLLDMELLRPALFGWAAALFGLDGFLHWGLNHYRSDQDPFAQSVVAHGGNNFLPAGDTHIVYPGQGRPWSSLRLEAQREGFEDFELLRLLQERDPARARRIVRRVIRGFDQYTKDARVLRAGRRAVLEALG